MDKSSVSPTPCRFPQRDGEWVIKVGKKFFSNQLCFHKKKRVIIAINEGGYNSTEVCLECVLELALVL